MASASPKTKKTVASKRSAVKVIFNGTTAIAEKALLMNIGDMYRIVDKDGSTKPKEGDFSEGETVLLKTLLKNYGAVIKDKLIVNTNSDFSIIKKGKKNIKNVKFSASVLKTINEKLKGTLKTTF